MMKSLSPSHFDTPQAQTRSNTRGHNEWMNEYIFLNICKCYKNCLKNYGERVSELNKCVRKESCSLVFVPKERMRQCFFHRGSLLWLFIDHPLSSTCSRLYFPSRMLYSQRKPSPNGWCSLAFQHFVPARHVQSVVCPFGKKSDNLALSVMSKNKTVSNN